MYLFGSSVVQYHSLTRLALQSSKVRHKVPVLGALEEKEGLTVSLESPDVQKLKELDATNLFYCNMLSANGYSGSKLRIKAPKRKHIVAVSKPNTLKRQEAMKKATTAGVTFQATRGGHLNSDDYFKAAELKAHDAQVKAMEELKRDRQKYCQDQWAALWLIQAKGELMYDTKSKFTLPKIKVMLKWKKVKPSGNKKGTMQRPTAMP
jgi:hypothetical protein